MKKLSFHYVCHWNFVATKNPFKKQLRHVMITYPFFLPSLFIIHVRVYIFTALYIITSHMSTFLSCTQFPHFQFIFVSLWIKWFNFLSMTTLLCYPCHKNYLIVKSFIYSRTTHYEKLVLTDVGFLKAHLSTSLAPSTSARYLG